MSNKSLNLPLLTWKDPLKSGKVFGGLVAALIILKSVNLLSLFFRLSSLALFFSAVAEYGGKLLLGQGLVSKFRPAKLSNSFSTRAIKYLESFANDLPALETEGQELLYSFNVENTLKSAGLFYVLYKITSWVSLYALTFSAIIAAFTIPFVYEQYQDEINAGLKQVSSIATQKLRETSKVVNEKAAPYIKQADEKLGPVSNFIKQKYQVRTASSTVAEEHPTAFSSSAETASSKTASVTPKTKEIPIHASSEPIAKQAPLDTTYHSSEPIATKPVPTPADLNLFPDAPKTEPKLETGNSFVHQVKEVAKDKEVDIDNLRKEVSENKEAALGAHF